MIPRKTAARFSGLIALLVLAAAAQSTPAHALDEARLRKLFDLMDLDGSGGIARPEYETGKGLVFATLDENVDFTLTDDELRLTPEAFQRIAGEDAKVDGMEFLSADVAAFEHIDGNQDLTLTFAELLDYVAKYAR